MVKVIMLEVTIVLAMKGDRNCHDFAQTQSSSSMTGFTTLLDEA
jgi:hypothetical protein